MLRHISMRSINRTIALAALGLGLTAFSVPSAQAAVIVESELTYSTTTKALMTAVDPNVTVSDYTILPDNGSLISTSHNHYFGRLDGSSGSRVANREKVATIDAAVENDVYGTFAIDVADGMQLDLTSLKIGMQIDEGASNETFSVYLRSSLDAYASNIGDPASLVGTGSPTLAQGTGTFDLTGLPSLTAETTFKLYMVANLPSGNSTTTKYIRIMPDIVLEGEISPIPEPGTLAFVGLSGLLMLRRRKASAEA